MQQEICPISWSNAGYILGYREAFDTFDENGDGTLCVKELMQIMMCVGFNPTDDDMPDYMAMLDKNSKCLCTNAFIESRLSNKGA